MSNPEQKPIAVLALNPAVDISYEIPQLVPDQKVRATKTLYHPGGNGINVARSLVELGVPMHCCSIMGGESGNLMLRMLGDVLGEGHRYIEVAGETRVNTTLLRKNPPSQYEVDSQGPEIDQGILDEVTSCFLETCGDSIGVLTGSTPPGVPDDTYQWLTERIKEQGGRVVLDAHGAQLRNALAARPNLLRLNRYVLEMSFKRRLETFESVAEAARDIQQGGVDFVCISLGNSGAILVSSDNSYHCKAPKVRLYSTVGAGDAMMAGMVAAHCWGWEAEDMLRLGVMCGSATASHPGTELFTKEEVDQSGNLEIRAMDI